MTNLIVITSRVVAAMKSCERHSRLRPATKSRRITGRTLGRRYSLCGDLLKRILVGGVSALNRSSQAFTGNDDACQRLACLVSRTEPSAPQGLGRNWMKDATKKATSDALAQLLAVTAMLVIASFVFYSR
jgi:hypothetical protein